MDGGALAVAPRLTVLLPTGSEDHGRGFGSVGMQTNLPVSYTLGSSVATHWNAGVTLVSESAPIWNLGASAIWLFRPTFNFMVEAIWLTRSGEETALLNPGVRWAHNFASGLQIVPSVAYTIGLGPSSGEDGLFLYLSLSTRSSSRIAGHHPVFPSHALRVRMVNSFHNANHPVGTAQTFSPPSQALAQAVEVRSRGRSPGIRG